MAVGKRLFDMGALIIMGLACQPAWAAGGAINLKHPVMDWEVKPERLAQYEKEAAPLLALSEEQMLALIPPYGYCWFCECPNCDGGTKGYKVLTWTIERPGELKCRFCDTVVYPVEQWSETRTLTGQNSLGETINFDYYYDEERQMSYFFSMHMWQHKRIWLLNGIEACARAYAVSGEEKYARPVALVLDRITQLYPHYPVMRNELRTFVFRESQQAPFPWNSGKWNYFNNEVPIEVIPAYDLVYSSPTFDQLSQERGYDLRERIERDFLRAATEAAMAYPDYVSNVIGYSPRSAAVLGRVINEPRYVHWAYGCMVSNVERGFYRDGMWMESPGYHRMTAGGLQHGFEVLQGYSDPPGYLDPVDGTRFDDLDPARQLPLWEKCLVAPELLRFPDGLTVAVHDTDANERAAPREESFSTIVPAFGHASLARGRGANQMLAQLHFSGSYGLHQHLDNLNFILWAKERELCPDLGYIHTPLRHWATTTLGHNTVVVNREPQASRDSDCDLLAYFPGDPANPVSSAVAAVEADGVRGYHTIPGMALYRRLLVMVPISEDDAYVVDVFRVRGGTTHDWTLHGDADHDMTATCSLPLTGQRQWMLEPGEEWVEPDHEWSVFNPYAMVREVARGDCPGEARFDFSYPGEAGRGLRVHLFTGGPAELWLGRSPSVRRAGLGSNSDSRKAYDFWMPQLIARRQAEAGLSSTFVAVHEPHSGRPFLGRVTRLAVTPDDGSCVALQIEHSAATDLVFSTNDETPYLERVTETGVRLRGRLGVVRLQAGKVTELTLLQGQSFSGEDWRVHTTSEGFRGSLEGVTRRSEGAAEDALITSADLPAGSALAGQWLSVIYPTGHRQGHEIVEVRKRDGKTFIVLADDPALRITGNQIREVYFPGRELEGTCAFEIPLQFTLSRQADGVYQARLSAEAEVTVPR